MSNIRHPELLADIEAFLAHTGMGESYFGKKATGNSEIVARLRSGGRVWPETERQARDFMAARLAEREV
jgi:hypothetical protein